eukprot:scaffold91482_cov28-Prasinocladus_malaysianus.AAC.1
MECLPSVLCAVPPYAKRREQQHDSAHLGVGFHGGSHLLHHAEIHGADVAEALSEDDVGPQLFDGGPVDGVEAFPGCQGFAHSVVHLPGVDKLVHLPREGRQVGDAGRKVALVAAPHQQVAAAHGTQDLCCAWQQADHPGLNGLDRLVGNLAGR